MVTDKHLQANFPGIETTPGVCGGRARIRGSRMALWFLESCRRSGMSDAEILGDYPHLTQQDLLNAWAYVQAHQEEIERDICEDAEMDQIIEESERSKNL